MAKYNGVMARCLTPPSHYMNHFWTTINEVLCHSAEGNFTENAHDICTWCEFETKSLHEPMLTDHQRGLVAFIWGQFHRKCSRYLCRCEFENHKCTVTVASIRLYHQLRSGTNRSGWLQAMLWLKPSAGPPLSVLKAMMVLFSRPFSCSAWVTLPIDSSMTDTMAETGSEGMTSGGHRWDYYSGTLKFTTNWSSNELQWLN